MGISDELKKLQSATTLMQAASIGNRTTDKTERVPSARDGSSFDSSIAPTEPGVRVAFFFDGTGNNLEADVGTKEHSNVARLFRAHQRDDLKLGIFRYYIPGIGTRFKDIGDPGGETRGLAFGGKGQKRLDWAMRMLEECVVQGKGRQIRIALFGFSRGAALARAFARLVADRCERGKEGWYFTHKNTRYLLRLYFMGLFDTVASVGAPMGTNNPQSVDLTDGLLTLQQALLARHSYGSTLDDIAFAPGGRPGADPASGPANGHMDWADELRIPEMVEDCLHMIAAHEIRNSFPVDSLLQGSSYPSNCRERVYPGAHSDVGGGYRPGEGARGLVGGSLLSLVPLRHMRDEATRAGVPLMQQLPVNLKGDFGEDPATSAAFQTLCRRFDLYMDKAGRGEVPVGSLMLSHMKSYYQWRFYKIARNRKNRAEGKPTEDEAILQPLERGWEREKNQWTASTNTLRSEADQAARAAKVGRQLSKVPMAERMFGAVGKPQTATFLQGIADQKENQYLSEMALLGTLPGSDGSFVRNSNLYDDQLLMDARVLLAFAKKKGRDNLRPHYKALLEAYEAEFERGQGLRNDEVSAFFDTYVHDSLAGFGKDATLPSDPRVIYIGGDDKSQHAMKPPSRRGSAASALG